MTENPNMYADMYAIHSIPTANMNSDDNGMQKKVSVGGALRTRVSSQAWKKAIRDRFDERAFRTKKAVALLVRKMMDIDNGITEAEASEKAVKLLKAEGVSLTKDLTTKVLLMLSPSQIDNAARYALSCDSKKYSKEDVREILKKDNSLDLALFGRMVAKDPALNVDAAVQFAHAFSTHRIEPEYDYFTALDDLQDKDEQGASHLDHTEYNASTFYRYANVNVNELIHNLNRNKEEGITGTVEFIRNFVLAMPTGMQNRHANKTLPSYLMVSLRTDTPVNLAVAFEKPVIIRNNEYGYTDKSIERLENEFNSTLKMVDNPAATFVLNLESDDTKVKGAVTAENLNDLLQRVSETLTKAVQDEDNND